MKHPLKILGIIFSAIAAIELVALVCVASGLSLLGEAWFVPPLVLGIQIVVFGSIGGGFLLYIRKKRLLRERLLTEGTCVYGTVTSTERVYNVRVNGRHPYRVIVRIERDGVLHEYRSDMLLHDPCLENGAEVPIYLDRYEEKKYFVDIDSVAREVIRH